MTIEFISFFMFQSCGQNYDYFIATMTLGAGLSVLHTVEKISRLVTKEIFATLIYTCHSHLLYKTFKTKTKILQNVAND